MVSCARVYLYRMCAVHVCARSCARVLRQLSIKKAENLAKCLTRNYKHNTQVALGLTNTARTPLTKKTWTAPVK